ncbi:MAG: 4Fe-4S dicluster domain-containing protein [Candidatus Aegiribacteria sp.]|nr:4Fe-4S dicluster domain-containing protein [Candidatus Aegiribacteria sp.]
MTNPPKNPVDSLVPIYFMGKRYEVPSSLTIQKALEYAGYQHIRGCGCRGGVCGACGTVYRTPDSYKLQVGLACQTVVQPEMHLMIMPYYPGNRSEFDIDELNGTGGELAALYPEIFKCIGCNACTQGCPMDIDVMHYMAQAIRGDLTGVAETSFDCIMCGLCASRCPAEEVQFNVAILARRMSARYGIPRAKHLEERVKEIESGRFEEPLKDLMNKSTDELKELYKSREAEPQMAEEDWTPQDARYV